MASDDKERAPRTDDPEATLLSGAADAGPASVTRLETVLKLTGRSSLVQPTTAEAAPVESARYEEQGEIGRGGMGSVHRTFDRVLLRAVAMKLIEPSLGDTGAGSRFVEEAQITGQLDHPNIVPIYDFGRLEDDQVYFTMKLVRGHTLSAEIADLHERSFAAERLERVLRHLLKVCEAISFAHSRGVIHRDLKPANIMVGSYGQVYVMDWGLGMLTASVRAARAAAARQDDGPARGGLEGTIAYMAPEQATGDPEAVVDTRTDVFALGAILYEVLTGSPPYESPSLIEGLARAAMAIVKPPEEVSSRPLPPGLCEIAMHAMQRDPGDRYQSVDELRAALESFLRGGGWFATRVFEAGQVIVQEGTPADAAYVLAEGRCEVYRGEGEVRSVLRTLGAGDVFGETALLNAEPRTASVAALERVVVKVITREAFERELGRSEWMAALVRQLAARFLALERGREGR